MTDNNFPSDIDLLKALDKGNLDGIKSIFKDYYGNLGEIRNKFSLEDQLTIVSTLTLHKIFQEKYGADAIALYMFYYYTAKWQKTNQPRAITNFCLRGLEWGETRFKRAKKILRKDDLIEDVFTKDDRGKITGWYIKIKYLWKNETIQKIKTTPPENLPTGKQRSNALSDNKVKCLKCNKKYSSLKDIKEVEFQLIATQYQVPISLVKSSYEDLVNYCQAHGRKYKNYLAALRNFVKKDAGVNGAVKKPKPQISTLPDLTLEETERAKKRLDGIRSKFKNKL